MEIIVCGSILGGAFVSIFGQTAPLRRFFQGVALGTLLGIGIKLFWKHREQARLVDLNFERAMQEYQTFEYGRY